jgi:hypothetical protein
MAMTANLRPRRSAQPAEEPRRFQPSVTFTVCRAGAPFLAHNRPPVRWVAPRPPDPALSTVVEIARSGPADTSISAECPARVAEATRAYAGFG